MEDVDKFEIPDRPQPEEEDNDEFEDSLDTFTGDSESNYSDQRRLWIPFDNNMVETSPPEEKIDNVTLERIINSIDDENLKKM